jgi:hypothetical protein
MLKELIQKITGKPEKESLPLEHRDLTRISKILTISCRLPEQKEPFTVMTGELDSNGMKCTAPLLLKDGEEMSVEILLSSSLPKLRIKGQVRWCRERAVRNHYDCGIQFIIIREDEKLYLKKYIERFAIEERKSA